MVPVSDLQNGMGVRKRGFVRGRGDSGQSEKKRPFEQTS
jgi:hypothetical protein